MLGANSTMQYNQKKNFFFSKSGAIIKISILNFFFENGFEF